MHRGLRIEIKLDALQHNLKQLKNHAGGKPVIAVVKADAYGHGAVEVSRVLIKAGADCLAVAFASEARQLREAGITAPILVMFERWDIASFFDLSLTPVLHDLATAGTVDAEAQRRNTVIDVHVKLDTGMCRMGFENSADLLQVLELKHIRIAGLMSHFSEADHEDKKFSLAQIEKFKGFADILAAKGVSPMRHMANSAATLTLPQSWFDAIRPGLALYGVSPVQEDYGLRPVMHASAKILTMRRVSKGQGVSYGRTFTAGRETVIAVLAAGYADGLPRALSNNAHAIVANKRAPLVGRICMDLTMLDVTDIKGVRDNDHAVLLGSGAQQTITAQDLAEKTGTIPYEILLGLGRGAMRTYS